MNDKQSADNAIETAVRAALSGVTPRPFDCHVMFNEELYTVAVRVDMKDSDAHWFPRWYLEDGNPSGFPLETVCEDIAAFCGYLRWSFRQALETSAPSSS